MDEELFFTRLAEATADDLEEEAPVAPARLRARVYSALVAAQAATGPLESLSVTKDAGQKLCVFEEIVARSPVSEAVKSKNPCRVCHARVLGENLDQAPIYWPHCPYAEFHQT